MNGELHLVDLIRGHASLGINLAGNKDRNTMSVFVAGVQPESVAGKDGRIQVGDELLEVRIFIIWEKNVQSDLFYVESLVLMYGWDKIRKSWNFGALC